MPGHYHNKRSSLLGKQPKPSAKTVKQRKTVGRAVNQLEKAFRSRYQNTPKWYSSGNMPKAQSSLKVEVKTMDRLKGMGIKDPSGYTFNQIEQTEKQTSGGRAFRHTLAKKKTKNRKIVQGAKNVSQMAETAKPSISKALRVAGPLGVALTLFDFLKGKPAL